MQESRSPAYINSYVKWPFRFDNPPGTEVMDRLCEAATPSCLYACCSSGPLPSQRPRGSMALDDWTTSEAPALLAHLSRAATEPGKAAPSSESGSAVAVYPRLVRDAVYTICGNRLRGLQFPVPAQPLQRGSAGTICLLGGARPLCLDEDAAALLLLFR